MNLPISVKLGGVFAVTAGIALIFSVIYWKIFNTPYVNAIFNAISIQTIGGNQLVPRTDAEKFMISTQFLLAYMITSGLIVITIHSAKNK